MNLQEYDVVRLRRPLTEHALPAGTAGTVVLVYDNPPGYEVEFTDKNGVTLALISVRQSDADGLLEKT
ncbi:MAG: DUF4926 domain-containing protein [Gammaproteobacteria bacterium]